MIYEDKYGRSVVVRCDCGCAYVEITKFNDDVDFNYYVSFYKNVNSLSLWDKLKIVKDILFGHSVLIQEIVLTDEKFKDFAKDVASITEENNG